MPPLTRLLRHQSEGKKEKPRAFPNTNKNTLARARPGNYVMNFARVRVPRAIQIGARTPHSDHARSARGIDERKERHNSNARERSGG